MIGTIVNTCALLVGTSIVCLLKKRNQRQIY